MQKQLFMTFGTSLVLKILKHNYSLCTPDCHCRLPKKWKGRMSIKLDLFTWIRISEFFSRSLRPQYHIKTKHACGDFQVQLHLLTWRLDGSYVLGSRPSRFIPEEVARGPHTQEARRNHSRSGNFKDRKKLFFPGCSAIRLKIVLSALSNRVL